MHAAQTGGEFVLHDVQLIYLCKEVHGGPNARGAQHSIDLKCLYCLAVQTWGLDNEKWDRKFASCLEISSRQLESR